MLVNYINQLRKKNPAIQFRCRVFFITVQIKLIFYNISPRVSLNPNFSPVYRAISLRMEYEKSFLLKGWFQSSSVMRNSMANFGGKERSMIGWFAVRYLNGISNPWFNPQFGPEYKFHTAHQQRSWSVDVCNLIVFTSRDNPERGTSNRCSKRKAWSK